VSCDCGRGSLGIYAAGILAKSDVPVAIDVLGTDIKRPLDMGIEVPYLP
jgi:hypothetical protein